MTPGEGRHAAEAEKTLGDYLTAHHDGAKIDLLGFAHVHALLGIDARLAGFTAAMQATMAALAPPMPDPDCPHCHGQGYVEGPLCNCGAGSATAYGRHERYCGLEQCPAGCPFVPPRPPQRLGGGD